MLALEKERHALMEVNCLYLAWRGRPPTVTALQTLPCFSLCLSWRSICSSLLQAALTKQQKLLEQLDSPDVTAAQKKSIVSKLKEQDKVLEELKKLGDENQAVTARVSAFQAKHSECEESERVFTKPASLPVSRRT